jgi:hypothetical protein
MIDLCKIHVLAYGNPICDVRFSWFNGPWKCLKKTKAGHPGHPLYLPQATPLQDFHPDKKFNHFECDFGYNARIRKNG